MRFVANRMVQLAYGLPVSGSFTAYISIGIREASAEATTSIGTCRSVTCRITWMLPWNSPSTLYSGCAASKAFSSLVNGVIKLLAAKITTGVFAEPVAEVPDSGLAPQPLMISPSRTARIKAKEKNRFIFIVKMGGPLWPTRLRGSYLNSSLTRFWTHTLPGWLGITDRKVTGLPTKATMQSVQAFRVARSMVAE